MKLAEIVKQALAEDLPNGDITTDSLELGIRTGRALIRAKDDLILSGCEAVEESFRQVNGDVTVKWHFRDGDFVWKNQTVAVVSGPIASMLKGERVALNFLGHLSGVATLTQCFVKQVEHTSCKILDTRKTLPLWRSLEKAAVRHGGGQNHRMSLSDKVLIKDNHLAAAGSIQTAVERMRSSGQSDIEVECSTIESVREAIRLKLRRILLDNMTNEQMAEAINLIPSSIETEASGNMTLERVREVAELGVQYISVGALTHSAPSVDFSMKLDLL